MRGRGAPPLDQAGISAKLESHGLSPFTGRYEGRGYYIAREEGIVEALRTYIEQEGRKPTRYLWLSPREILLGVE